MPKKTKKKVLTDDDLKDLAVLSGYQLAVSRAMWDLALRSYRINSQEYRDFVRLGKETQHFYSNLKQEAWLRGWDRSQIYEFFVQENVFFN
jgi:hypothetical protein